MIDGAEAALEKAKQVAGGTAKLAAILNITSQAISQWDRVPIERVLEVERLTGVPRYEQRPDIYPAPQPEAAA